MKLTRVLLLILISVLLSCNRNRSANIISDTDSLVMTNPKQVLTILDSIENTSNLGEKELLHLVWNRALAHQALGMSMVEDEHLQEAIAYFREEKEKQADSYLLEASYLNWAGKDEDAIKTIEKGIAAISDSTKRVQLLAAKASIFEHQRKYDQTVNVLKEILKSGLTKREQAIFNYKIGLNLSLMGDSQSEQFYEKSIQQAMENNDTAMACEFMRNHADYLANNGQYRRSNDIYHRIGRILPQVAELSAIQMAMAGNYINLHRLDSARICHDKAIKSETELEAQGFTDIARKAELEQERVILDYTDGKAVSFVDFARYCDSITMDMQMKENTSTRRLEAKNRLQTANYELKLNQQRMGWLLSVATLLLIGGGIGGWLYRRNKIKQSAEAEDRIDTLARMLEEAQKTIAEEESDIKSISSNADELERPKSDDDAFFKKILLQQLGIIRLVASTPTNQNQALLKRISGISGGEIPTNSLLVWSDLYPVIDRLYNNFHTRLMEQYGDALTEKEEQICCLLCAGFSTKEIGVITQQSDATIYVRKTSIRKKIRAAEGQDIVACVNEQR